LRLDAFKRLGELGELVLIAEGDLDPAARDSRLEARQLAK
jgi:hypothetical protein